jgi:hypothetical protein
MKFEDWFDETEVFSLRSERFYDDLITYKLEGVEAEHLVKWLRAAYDAGHEHGQNWYVDDGR